MRVPSVSWTSARFCGDGVAAVQLPVSVTAPSTVSREKLPPVFLKTTPPQSATLQCGWARSPIAIRRDRFGARGLAS